jgi:Abortive infection C-terminus
VTGRVTGRYFGGAPTTPFRLERPDGLDETAWAAIEQALTRLNTAIGTSDLQLVIGCAKELAESVAKVVLVARGNTVASGAKFPDVLGSAHVALDRQPGQGLAADAQVRNIAQGAKTVASQLPELRNKYGTGHGRAVAPEVVDELALVAVDGALLWVRWALRRLHHLIKGRPDLLIRDLEDATFYRGDLAERLAAARLAEHEEVDQYQVGFHVARRAMRDTFLVMEEGVEACTESPDLERWPPGYRIGLLNGLFLTANGLIDATPWSVKQAALLLQTSANKLTDAIAELAEKLRVANYGIRLGDDTARKEAESAAQDMRSQIPTAVRASWQIIEKRLIVPF